MNILITSGGKRVDIIQEFQRALGKKGKVYITDTTPHNAGRFFADGLCLVPKITDPKYTSTLKRIVKQKKITLLCPVNDSELTLLAKEKEHLAALGCTVFISDSRAIGIGRDKRKTAAFLERLGVKTPKVLAYKEVKKFPVFVKPVDGSSSKHAYRIDTKEELMVLHKRVPNALLLEYVEGQEYSIDCLGDLEGKPIAVIPRRRVEITNGISTKSIVDLDAAIISDCKKIMEALPVVGPAVLQCIKTPRGNYFLEFNLRFGGGSLVGSRAGGDFFKKIIGMKQGKKYSFSTRGIHNGFAMVAYLEHIFYDKSYRIRS